MRGPVGTVLLLVVFFASASDVKKPCQIRQDKLMICRCIGRKEFDLPEDYNYNTITTLHLSSCTSANLELVGLTVKNNFQNVTVRNVENRLNFELALWSESIKLFRLTNVGRVSLITHTTFIKVSSINTLQIEDTVIEDFEEEFTKIKVTNFFLINVTIKRMEGMDFSEKGATLRIINSSIRNIKSDKNLACFAKVEILDSNIELQSPGLLNIEGNTVLIENSTFSNTSINVIASSNVTVNRICADGKSSLRLLSNEINSSRNMLPTEIVYPNSKPGILNVNNTVCVAGNCKCLKSHGKRQASHPVLSMFASQVFLLTLLSAIL